jgi:hypothetical protein
MTMQTCPECDKKLATSGGLEVHMQMAHAKPRPDAQPEPEVTPSAPEPAPRAARGSLLAEARERLRDYDPKVLVNAALVAILLLAGIVVVLNRSAAHPTSLATASAPHENGDAATTTTTAPAVASTLPATPTPTAPRATTPLTQPPLFSQPPPRQSPSRQSTPSAAATQTASDCQSVINSLSSRTSRRTVDAGDLMTAHTFPGPSVPGAPSATVVDDQAINSVDELAAGADPNDPDDQQMLKLLRQSGFQTLHAIDFNNGATDSIAVAFRFGTPSAALAFDRALLTDDCENQGMTEAKSIPGLTGGMSFTDDGDMPYSAAFVAGDTVVALGMCDCVNVPNPQGVVAQWAQTAAARLGAV